MHFECDGYGARSGEAILSEGLVGDVVASITLDTVTETDEPTAFLRYDPARVTVDLLLKLDLDAPWSLESSKRIPTDLEEEVVELASTFDLDRAAMFELMLAVNNDLGVCR